MWYRATDLVNTDNNMINITDKQKVASTLNVLVTYMSS